MVVPGKKTAIGVFTPSERWSFYHIIWGTLQPMVGVAHYFSYARSMSKASKASSPAEGPPTAMPRVLAYFWTSRWTTILIACFPKKTHIVLLYLNRYHIFLNRISDFNLQRVFRCCWWTCTNPNGAWFCPSIVALSFQGSASIQRSSNLFPIWARTLLIVIDHRLIILECPYIIHRIKWDWYIFHIFSRYLDPMGYSLYQVGLQV